MVNMCIEKVDVNVFFKDMLNKKEKSKKKKIEYKFMIFCS